MIRHSFREGHRKNSPRTQFSWLCVRFTRPKETIFLCVYMSSASLLPCEIQSWHYRHFIFKTVGMVLVEGNKSLCYRDNQDVPM